MPNAHLYVEGEEWSIMGNVVDSFVPYTNNVETARNGRTFPNQETRTRKLRVDEVKADPAELDAILEFFEGCRAVNDKFVVTVVLNDDCDPQNGGRWDYFGALINGEGAEFSIFERKITGLEFSYEERRSTQTATAPVGLLQ